MNKKFYTILFAAAFALFAFSSAPAVACPTGPKCEKCKSKSYEGKKCDKKKAEKKCKKGCTKPCCAKKADGKKCTKKKSKSEHSDNSRYND